MQRVTCVAIILWPWVVCLRSLAVLRVYHCLRAGYPWNVPNGNLVTGKGVFHFLVYY